MALRAAWKISKWSHACRHRSKAKRFPKNQTCMPIAPRAGLVGCDVYSPWPLPGTIALIPRVVLAGSCRGPVALTPAVAGDCCTHPAGRTSQLHLAQLRSPRPLLGTVALIVLASPESLHCFIWPCYAHPLLTRSLLRS